MDSIFHFTNLKNGFEILSEMKLKFNSLLYTNDPWENQIQLFSVCESANYSNDIIGFNKRFEDIDYLNKLNNETIQLLKKYQVLCFSKSFKFQNKKVYGYNKPRMWAHYGDNHKGFCFEFNVSELQKAINRSFPDNFIKQEKVIYKLDFKRIENPLSTNTDIENFFDSNYKSLFFQKNLNWRDEHEYRVLLKNKDNSQININKCIKTIYIGSNFGSADFPLLEFYEKKLDIQIFKMNSINMNLEKEYYKNFDCI